MAFNGYPRAANGVQTWDPKALLAPNLHRQVPTTPSSIQASPKQSPSPGNAQALKNIPKLEAKHNFEPEIKPNFSNSPSQGASSNQYFLQNGQTPEVRQKMETDAKLKAEFANLSHPATPNFSFQDGQAYARQKAEPETKQRFLFDSPSQVPSAGPSSRASTPSSMNGYSSNGLRPLLDELYSTQDRSNVPQPKRRKLEDQNASPGNGPFRRGTGMLNPFEKGKQEDGKDAIAAPLTPTARTTTVDLTDTDDGNDDEVTVVKSPHDEEVCYGMIKTSLNCFLMPSPKPGAQSLFGPSWQPGIKVVLKRKAGDRTLTMQAYDHTRQTIGHVDPLGSRGIAPLHDSNIGLRTECRIPPQPKRPGEVPGQQISRSFPLDVVMYGPSRYAKSLGAHLSKYNIKLVAPYLVQKGIRVQNPHVLEFRPPPPKVYPTNDSQGTYATSSANRTVEEIKSEVMGVFDSLTRSEDLPEMEPHDCITTPLLKHQKQGLYFMMNREKPRDLHEKAMVSFWRVKKGPTGQNLFFNVITGTTQAQPPAETRGGILADMMGLGKTLSILSLLATSMEAAREWEEQSPMKLEVSESKSARHEALAPQPSLELTPVLRNTKATLLVCPLSTVTNWEEQIKQHVRPWTLNYHIYHGSNRIKDPAKLATYDLIITTYGSVSNELSARRKGKDGQYPLEQLGWFRVVLDEAHMIREHSTLQFKAICRLQADRRWAVTGTPVQNRLDDLAALLAFLRLHPFHDRGKFLRYIVEPFKACDPEIVPKLRVLVDTITLRRLKDKIDLPPREDLVIKLDFSPEERNIYELFARNAQDRVSVLAGTNNGNKALGGNTYIHILKAILRLRLLCAHGKDLLNESDLKTLEGMSAETPIDIDEDDDQPALSEQRAHEIFTLLQDTNSDSCNECSRKLGSIESSNLESEAQDDVLGFMTPCFHVICRNCIKAYKDRIKAMVGPGVSSGMCPVCKDHVKFEYTQLHRRDVDAEHNGLARPKSKNPGTKIDNYDGPHTKTKALIEDLLKSKAASEANPSEPPYKSVVFSGWTSHLDLIELALNANGINFVRLDGSMSRIARTSAMDRFREDNSVHVILVSIMAGGLGLNLTAGNNVYVMEPQYNPAAEAQAVDRVHRLGQKRPVKTVRYIIRDSFEEKMLELQDKKKRLATLSMDGQNRRLDKGEAARQKLMDLRSLFK